ncbi:MAG: hypothetical protein ACXVJ7_08000 [Acidimicrobiia bacterium]
MSKHRITQRAFRVAAISGVVFGALAPAAAHAADYPAGGGTSTPKDPGSQVQGTTATKSASLPFTGGDVTGMAAIGAGAVLAGAVIVRQSRRRAIA